MEQNPQPPEKIDDQVTQLSIWQKLLQEYLDLLKKNKKEPPTNDS